MTERRAAAQERRRQAARRRRGGLAVLVVLLVAAGIGACTAIKRDSGASSTTTTVPGTTGGGTSHTSTTKAGHVPSAYDVGVRIYHWDDTSRTTVNPSTGEGTIPGRILTTEIWYPALTGSTTAPTAGARPATVDGPFPVVLFAHGFDLTPQYYSALLDSWVSAGFVVVAPLFPDEQTDTVVASGGPVSSDAEYDLPNEPGDLAYVAKQFAAVDAKRSGSALSGIGDLADLALAGQSDGGDAVAGLAYGSAYTSDYASLPAVPKAVLVLSGQALNGDGDTESATASSPALLQVQSTADPCNDPVDATDLFGQLFGTLANAPTHLFMTLDGVGHLPPYSGGTDSAVVEKVTTEFLRLELGRDAKGLTVASVTEAGSVPGTSSVSANPAALPYVATDCTGLPTTRAAPVR